MRAIRRLILLIAGASVTASAHAAILLSASFSDNFPFGPFRPRERIEILISLTNTSTDQTITICEGPCIGDALTYSLGGLPAFLMNTLFSSGTVAERTSLTGRLKEHLIRVRQRISYSACMTPLAGLHQAAIASQPVADI